MKKIVFYLSIFFTLTLCAQSQKNNWEYALQKYTTADGLPSLEVYQVHEDIFGYLWFCTDHGLVRYDSYQFEVFTQKDGLSDNTVFRLYEDRKGNMWIVCRDGKLVFYDRKEFHPFYPEKILKGEKKNYRHYALQNDTLVFSRREDAFTYKAVFPNYIEKVQAQDYNIFDREKTDIPKNIHDSIKNKRTKKIWRAASRTYNDSIQIAINTTLFSSFSDAHLILRHNDTIVYNKSLDASKIGFHITTIFDYKDGKVAIGTNRGVYIFNVHKGKTEKLFFENEFITSSMIDKEGNYWFSSRDDGVWMMPSYEIQTINPNKIKGKNKFTRIKIVNEKLYAADVSGQIYLLNNDYSLSKQIHENRLNELKSKESFDFILDSLHNFYVGTLPYKYEIETNSFKRKKGASLHVKSMLQIHKDTLLLGLKYGVNLLNVNNLETKYDDRRKHKVTWCTALLKDSKGTIWVGASEGLFQLKNHAFIPFKHHQHDLLKKRILALSEYKDNHLLIGTKGEGLVIVNNEQVYNITEVDGLVGNMVQCIYVDKNNVIWIGTNKGVSKIEHLVEEDFEITNFTTYKGLPSNMINDIKTYDGKIWLATSKGLSYLDETKFQKNTKPLRTYIKNINVDGKIISHSAEHLNLKYDQNNIRFNFLAICTRCNQKTIYKYRLVGFNDRWFSTQNQNVQYTSLLPGDYTFQLMAANEDGVWNTTSVEKHFTIHPHFSDTLWFKIVCTLLTLLIAFTILYMLVRRQKRKIQLQLKLAKLEEQALRASMNPHFVFNALSSIQDFINRNNALEANEYLVKFSRLIRANLEVTKANEVLVSEELERLELYLNIEKLRFEEKLNYTIEIDKKLAIGKIKIPVMILQPFVENAIIHGILPKDKGGNITIECKKVTSNQFQVSIIDDGIGIKNTTRKIVKKHTSLSTDFTKNRLELLSKSTAKKYSFKIMNRNEISQQNGTIVQFTLPIITD